MEKEIFKVWLDATPYYGVDNAAYWFCAMNQAVYTDGEEIYAEESVESYYDITHRSGHWTSKKDTIRCPSSPIPNVPAAVREYVLENYKTKGEEYYAYETQSW